jgi:EAL domain-containing protein (putative c-di-GMP-specific phosphodiesterase class I)/DNA-binding NarL/FixJ family response regulator
MNDPIATASILVVEDDPAARRLLERLLGRAGFQTIHAESSGERALARFDQIAPDLVLVDLHLPGMTGLDVLAAIRARLEPDDFLPLVVLTGDPDRAARTEALARGATDYLQKPLDPTDVVLRARNLVQTRLLHRQVRLRNQQLAAEVDVTARALRDLSDEWMAVAAAIARLSGGGSAESTAAAICAELISLRDLAGAAIVAFATGDMAVPLAVASIASGVPLAVNVPLPSAWAGPLRQRAGGGGWIGEWSDAVDARSPGQMTIACLPLREGDTLLGLLVVGAERADGAQVLARRLPALEAVASHASALLARDILERQRGSEVWLGIDQAIRERAFTPVFQPIVRLIDGVVVGHEALTRFADGVRPDRRFADALAVGRGTDLELVTLRAVLDAAAALRGDGFVTLNVSPGLVLGGDALPALLADPPVPIVLELTEHRPVEDYRSLRMAIRALGTSVRFAVDDAGSGFASFRHILELRPDFVKLDLGVVRGIDQDPARQAFVAAMVYFTTLTGCGLIAEGIETEPERRALAELGVDLAQGHLLGRPTEARAARRRVR